MITAVADTGADRRAATTLGGMDQGNSGDAGRGTARPKAGSSFVAGQGRNLSRDAQGASWDNRQGNRRQKGRSQITKGCPGRGRL